MRVPADCTARYANSDICARSLAKQHPIYHADAYALSDGHADGDNDTSVHAYAAYSHAGAPSQGRRGSRSGLLPAGPGYGSV